MSAPQGAGVGIEGLADGGEFGGAAEEGLEAGVPSPVPDRNRLYLPIDRPGERLHVPPMLAALLLLLVVAVYRVISGFAGSADLHWLHNFAPVAAVALCGAVYLPRRVAVVLPLAILFASDVVLNVFVYHKPLLTFEIVPRYVALALISGLGFALRERPRLPSLLGASFLGSLVFFAITNTGSWISDPGYAKNFAGWLQALGPGLPDYPSTWWFYRHTLFSDLLFTLLFVACMSWQTKKAALPVARSVAT
ncbi:MAG: hypothetical protein QOE70_2643 [Chthoniobacter sp.]|nr:hypothetical protein [Chthoniobacter sp.]